MQLYDPKGYALACDSCGCRLAWSGRKTFATAYAAVAAAKNLGWSSLKGRVSDLCPDCRRKGRRKGAARR